MENTHESIFGSRVKSKHGLCEYTKFHTEFVKKLNLTRDFCIWRHRNKRFIRGAYVCARVDMVATLKGHGDAKQPNNQTTKQPILCSVYWWETKCPYFFHSEQFRRPKRMWKRKIQAFKCKYFETEITHQRTFPSFPWFNTKKKNCQNTITQEQS